jgi:hypothetical protein
VSRRTYRILLVVTYGFLALALGSLVTLLVIPDRHYENRGWTLALLTTLFVSIGIAGVVAVTAAVFDLRSAWERVKARGK